MTTSTPTQQSTELVRPLEGRVIAGVAAGLGRRFAVNPWWFRIGLIVLALFGGFGLIVYGIGWVLIPEEGTDEALLPGWIAGSRGSSTGTLVGVALIAVAALILLSTLDILSGPLVFAGALFVIGVLLYRGDITGSGRSPDDPDDANDHEGGDVTDTMTPALEDPGGDGDPPLIAEPTLPPEPPAPEERSRSILGQLTLAATLIALGGLALLDAAGILYPTFPHYVAVALGVIGGGLIVGALLGRARWLIAIGLVLMPVLFVASVVPRWDFSGETGDVRFNVASVAELAPEYSLAAGSLRLDLSDFEPDPGVVTELEVGVGAGEVRIDVPADVAVRVDASVGIGAVDVLGDQRAGIGVDVVVDTGSPAQLVLIVEAGFGNIVVREG